MILFRRRFFENLVFLGSQSMAMPTWSDLQNKLEAVLDLLPWPYDEDPDGKKVAFYDLFPYAMAELIKTIARFRLSWDRVIFRVINPYDVDMGYVTFKMKYAVERYQRAILSMLNLVNDNWTEFNIWHNQLLHLYEVSKDFADQEAFSLN